MMKKHAGFTLAEVLITLGIIGVVAAMTIPTLMSNTGKAEFKTAFKKIISAVNQAVTLSVAIDYMDFGDATSGTGADSVFEILRKKMQIAKTESSGVDDIKRMFGTTGGSNYTIFFADGMVLSYPQSMHNCTNYDNINMKGCAAIVDVNGVKNPNRLSNCQYSAASGNLSTIQSDHTIGGSGGNSSFCGEENTFVSDQYSVRFKGQQLIPNGYAARYVLYEK